MPVNNETVVYILSAILAVDLVTIFLLGVWVRRYSRLSSSDAFRDEVTDELEREPGDQERES